MAKAQTVTAYGMYCNSMCNCGLLKLTIDCIDFDDKDFHSKNYHVRELQVTIKKGRKLKARKIH